MSLERSFLQRALRAKVAYRLGIDLFHKNIEAYNGIALVMMDNALELLGSAALDYLSSDSSKQKLSEPSFMDTIVRLDRFLYRNLRERQDGEKSILDVKSISRLHNARNMSQHKGITPSRVDLEGYVSTTSTALSEICQIGLGIEFGSMSLGELISDQAVRQLYIQAEAEFDQKQFRDCILRCGAAFLIAKVTEELRLYGSMRTLSELPYNYAKQKMVSPVKELSDYVEKIAEELDVLRLGLDYKSYQMFREIFGFQLEDVSFEPKIEEGKVQFDPSDTFSALKNQFGSNLDQMSQDVLEKEARYCLLFILDPILKWELLPRTSLPALLYDTLSSIFANI